MIVLIVALIFSFTTATLAVYCDYLHRKNRELYDHLTHHFDSSYLLLMFAKANHLQQAVLDFKKEIEWSRMQGRVKQLDYELFKSLADTTLENAAAIVGEIDHQLNLTIEREENASKKNKH